MVTARIQFKHKIKIKVVGRIPICDSLVKTLFTSLYKLKARILGKITFAF